MTLNGWIDDGVGFGWFKDGFVPWAKSRLDNPDDKILLIFDGHNSHKTNELIDYTYEHGIYLYNLPPHTTHKLQPLDARIFAAVDRAWKNRCDERTTIGQPMTMDTLVREYMDIRPTAMQPSLILDAFRVTGIHPLTLSVFKPEDFAPSAATSASAHLPSTYPSLVPSSPIKLPDNYDYSDEETDADYDPEAEPDYDIEVSRETGGSPSDLPTAASNVDCEPTTTPASTQPLADDEVEAEFEERMDEETLTATCHDEDESERSEGEEDERMVGWDSVMEEEDDDDERTGDTPTQLAADDPQDIAKPIPPQRRFFRLPTAFGDRDSPAPLTSSHLTRSTAATLFSPAPTASSLPTPRITSRQAKASKIQLTHELRRMSTKLQFSEANLTAANAHCTVMAMENAELREQLALANAKKGRKGRSAKQALGVFLTPPARKEARRVEREQREADATVAAEEQRQKEAAAQARRQQRLHNAIHLVFDKPLSSHQHSKKDELQDLAAALALEETGTKAVIFARIEEHVKSHPELEQNERFKALFGTSRRGGGTRRPPFKVAGRLGCSRSTPTASSLDNFNIRTRRPSTVASTPCFLKRTLFSSRHRRPSSPSLPKPSTPTSRTPQPSSQCVPSASSCPSTSTYSSNPSSVHGLQRYLATRLFFGPNKFNPPQHTRSTPTTSPATTSTSTESVLHPPVGVSSGTRSL